MTFSDSRPFLTPPNSNFGAHQSKMQAVLFLVLYVKKWMLNASASMALLYGIHLSSKKNRTKISVVWNINCFFQSFDL